MVDLDEEAELRRLEDGDGECPEHSHAQPTRQVLPPPAIDHLSSREWEGQADSSRWIHSRGWSLPTLPTIIIPT